MTTNCWRRNLIWSVSSMIVAACHKAVVDVFCSVCSPCGQWCTFVILSDQAGDPTCPLVWRACVNTTARPWPLSWQGGPTPGHRGRGVAICLPPTQVTYPFCSHLFWLCCGSQWQLILWTLSAFETKYGWDFTAWPKCAKFSLVCNILNILFSLNWAVRHHMSLLQLTKLCELTEVCMCVAVCPYKILFPQDKLKAKHHL